MSLTVRMGLAFGLLVLVILVLGIIGVVNMQRIGRLSNSLATDDIPDVTLANNIERHALAMVPSLHDYGYTDMESFLVEVQFQLGEVKKLLADAKARVGNSGQPAKLKEAAVLMDNTVLDFEALTEQRTNLTETLGMERTSAFAAGTNFISICSLFLERQTEAMQGKIAADIDGDQLDLNLQRISYLSDIVRTGNLLLGNTWKAQAQRNPKILGDSLGLLDAINTQFDKLDKITDFQNDKKLIAECRASCQRYRVGIQRFQETWNAREEVARRQTVLAASIIEQAHKVASLGLDDTTVATKKTAGVAAFSSTLAIVCGIIGVVFGVVIAAIITRKLGSLLRSLALCMNEGSMQVANAASQVSSASQSLAEGASQQAASLEETSSSLEEMSSMTKRNSENARKANDLAKEARTAADKGAGDMQSMSAAMEAIKVSSDDIAKIIRTIDEIAFQTNILALNAAVEAARAGQAGAGFAVVADEVRNLAQRSAQAAKETANKIEGAITNTGQGVDICRKVAGALNDIVVKVRQVDELVAEVAGASLEQTQGITQINTAVTQMDKVTQSNAASAEESAAAAAELNGQAAVLKESVVELLQLAGGNIGQDKQASIPSQSSRIRASAQRQRVPSKAGANGSLFRMAATDRKLNCWEFKQCGREAGGAKARELGVCPAYPDHGQDCASLAGTLCGGKVQGSFAHKIKNCMQCDFYNSPHYDDMQSQPKQPDMVRKNAMVQSKPTVTGPAKGRSHLPLEGDFKDF